jgi:hypothetical protein
VHWTLFGLMISGGSAFWTSVVSFASAAKDARALAKADMAEQLAARQAPKPAAGVVPTI